LRKSFHSTALLKACFKVAISRLIVAGPTFSHRRKAQYRSKTSTVKA